MAPNQSDGRTQSNPNTSYHDKQERWRSWYVAVTGCVRIRGTSRDPSRPHDPGTPSDDKTHKYHVNCLSLLSRPFATSGLFTMRQALSLLISHNPGMLMSKSN